MSEVFLVRLRERLDLLRVCVEIDIVWNQLGLLWFLCGAYVSLSRAVCFVESYCWRGLDRRSFVLSILSPRLDFYLVHFYNIVNRWCLSCFSWDEYGVFLGGQVLILEFIGLGDFFVKVP